MKRFQKYFSFFAWLNSSLQPISTGSSHCVWPVTWLNQKTPRSPRTRFQARDEGLSHLISPVFSLLARNHSSPANNKLETKREAQKRGVRTGQQEASGMKCVCFW